MKQGERLSLLCPIDPELRSPAATAGLRLTINKLESLPMNVFFAYMLATIALLFSGATALLKPNSISVDYRTCARLQCVAPDQIAKGPKLRRETDPRPQGDKPVLR
jgi:hypothetical protein